MTTSMTSDMPYDQPNSDCSSSQQQSIEREFTVHSYHGRVLQLRRKYTGASESEVEGNKILIVTTHGSCPPKIGLRTPRAMWGVRFGKRSPHNVSGLLNPSFPQSCIFAKIEALSQAVHIIQRDFAHDDTVRSFYIVTDLDRIVNERKEWVEDWIRRANFSYYPILEKTNESLDETTCGHEELSFKFGTVPQDNDEEADFLPSEIPCGFNLGYSSLV
ncbi:ribonuclease H-like protein [Annulohypoxylon moriforme]|nr:ribonuclease H-like protein [Annulohypoxylon moriforme]